MQQLTKAEEEIMQYLWKREKAFVKEIVDEFPEPKPAYNTVSTIIRILEKKGIVGFKAFGRSHRYFPLIDKEEYRCKFLIRFIESYFNGSYSQLVSLIIKQKKLSLPELKILSNELKDAEDE